MNQCSTFFLKSRTHHQDQGSSSSQNSTSETHWVIMELNVIAIFPGVFHLKFPHSSKETPRTTWHLSHTYAHAPFIRKPDTKFISTPCWKKPPPDPRAHYWPYLLVQTLPPGGRAIWRPPVVAAILFGPHQFQAIYQCVQYVAARDD